MKEQNLTVSSLAEKAGVSASTVRKALQGGNILLDTLTLLAVALGVEPMELVSARPHPRFERFAREAATALSEGTPEEISLPAMRGLMREASSPEEEAEWLLWLRILMTPEKREVVRRRAARRVEELKQQRRDGEDGLPPEFLV
ncbi:MAG: helix-turn-helix transcriptional regulator [Clostridiales bacterium]|nr:helix-turn-helix transcriptional regulator [Clostridiales bacterium]